MRPWMSVCVVLVAGGCTLDRTPLLPDDRSGPDAGARLDAGPLRDAAGRDDAGPPRDDAGPPRDDAGPPRDAGMPDAGPPPSDAGPPCLASQTGCEGERAITCTPGGLVHVDCAASGGYCQMVGDAPSCIPWACVPSTTRCSDDGTSVLTCDARGATSSSMACSLGCAAGACRAPSGCTRPVAATLSGTGMVDFSLCGGGNDDDYADMTGDGCRDSFTADGEDRLVRLELDRPRTLAIEVLDADGARNIDPVVYVRRRCDDASHVACGDDRTGSLNPLLTVSLEAGEYFLVVDSFDYSSDGRSFGCGTVRVIVRTP